MTAVEIITIAVKEPKMWGILAAILLLAWLPVSAAILSRRLNPKFDYYFIHELWFAEMATPVPASHVRAGIYASWVTSRRIFACGRPEAQTFDFRSHISRGTYYICLSHTLIGVPFVVGSAIFTIYSLITK
jgi:hypothetical protein